LADVDSGEAFVAPNNEFATIKAKTLFTHQQQLLVESNSAAQTEPKSGDVL